ncbi:MAG: hypothetical protein FWC00_05845 [Firmicutes bacterium]|nr:hypothetical protein [Bacillota bacterium]
MTNYFKIHGNTMKNGNVDKEYEFKGTVAFDQRKFKAIRDGKPVTYRFGEGLIERNYHPVLKDFPSKICVQEITDENGKVTLEILEIESDIHGRAIHHETTLRPNGVADGISYTLDERSLRLDERMARFFPHTQRPANPKQTAFRFTPCNEKDMGKVREHCERRIGLYPNHLFPFVREWGRNTRLIMSSPSTSCVENGKDYVTPNSFGGVPCDNLETKLLALENRLRTHINSIRAQSIGRGGRIIMADDEITTREQPYTAKNIPILGGTQSRTHRLCRPRKSFEHAMVETLDHLWQSTPRSHNDEKFDRHPNSNIDGVIVDEGTVRIEKYKINSKEFVARAFDYTGKQVGEGDGRNLIDTFNSLELDCD